jgi:hypothetical protein
MIVDDFSIGEAIISANSGQHIVSNLCKVSKNAVVESQIACKGVKIFGTTTSSPSASRPHLPS